MGRTGVRPVQPARNRKARDGLLLAAVGLIVAFAIVGVVSAGIFAVGKFSSSPAAKPHVNTPVAIVPTANLAQAKSQATAIVKAAQAAGDSIVKSATSKANRQAAGIIAKAKKQARTVSQPAVVPTVPVTAPITVPQPVVTSVPGAQPITVQTSTGSTGSGVPNLAGVPAAWLVVGYNATFGSGPGGVGGVSVINRGSRAYSGTVTVRFTRGGSASASFGGLAPGQSQLLPLNGSRYPGGGYRIVVNVG